LQQYSPAVALDPTNDSLVARLSHNGEYVYNVASVHMIHFRDADDKISEDFFCELVKMFGDIQELKNAISTGQNARNKIFYADSAGYPTGFENPEHSLERECQISLGLIWASVDIHRRKGELSPLIVQALRTANLAIAELKKGI